MKKALLISGTAAILFGGTALAQSVITAQPMAIDVQLNAPTQIQWTQPTDDAGWAQDVKQESLDLKSTDVLQQMLVDQKAGLAQATSSIAIYTDCPQCVKYNLQKAHTEWTQTDIDNEFTNEFNQQEWLVEKITQSIIRIEHELDLRARGVVVPDKQDMKGTPAKATDLQKVAPSMIRHIDD